MRLMIASRVEAGRLLYHYSYDHLISLGDLLPANWLRGGRLLRLTFDDIEEESVASIMAGYVAPSDDDIAQIVTFAQTIEPDDRVLIHCAQGISRSTAAAMIVLMTRGATKEQALAEVLRIRPIARPNTLMLRLHEEMTCTP